jgi:hypothetical protein
MRLPYYIIICISLLLIPPPVTHAQSNIEHFADENPGTGVDGNSEPVVPDFDAPTIKRGAPGSGIRLISPSPERVPDPDPHRFDREFAAFEEWDAKNSSPDNAILFVGSSSIRLWKTAEAFPEYPVINRGFGGSHIPDLIHHYDRVIGRFDPALIVFYCGENDVASGVPVDQVFGDYTRLLDRILNDFPDVHFLYISIKPSNSRIQHSGKFMAFNRMAEEFNRGDWRLHYIDLATALVGTGNKTGDDNGNGIGIGKGKGNTSGPFPDDAYFLPDRLHLNEKGYEAWNRLLSPVFSGMVNSGIISTKKPGVDPE